MKKELLIVFLLLLLSIPAVKDLFKPGGFVSHDLTHHIVRQISMDKLLSEGQFPPRWSADLNKGYGYPVFLFNYPLTSLLGEIFHKLGLNFVSSVKAVLFTSLILSALGMYLFLKAYLDFRLASFLGAIFYLYAPHRLLSVYVSAALGSALGGAILPFVFWSMVQVQKTKKLIWVLIGSIIFALLVLAHNITSLIFSVLILAFGAVLIGESDQKIKLLKRYLLMFALGLGMSCWFWLPAIWEKQYIIFDSVYGKFYQNQFPTLKQLIGSFWGFGIAETQAGDLSYQIGLIHILAMLFLTTAVFIFKKIRKPGILIIFFFVLSLFLILKISKPVWDIIPLLSYVQYPWRFTAVTVFTSSIGVALLIKYLPYKKLLAISFLLLVIYANRNHWKVNRIFDPGENYYYLLNSTTASYDEHLPKWGRKMEKESSGKLEFVSGAGEIKVIQDESAKVLAEVEAGGPAALRFNQFYFPGWEIQVDQKKIAFNYLADGESYGLPVFDIQTGKHQIKAEFKNTAVRNWADAISLISIVAGLLCLLTRHKVLF